VSLTQASSLWFQTSACDAAALPDLPPFVGGSPCRPIEVLHECGRILRQLHALDPTLLGASSEEEEVIQHGDFGPNNILLEHQTFDVAAVLDWEFSGVGPAITDIAWCEWIVRMHHPDAVSMLADFFDASGARPTWKERQAEMLRRCRSLKSFAKRWDPASPAVTVWQERASAVASWVE
jgi:Ser/Thr protein kinase RdoA (MazF antagonist)